VKDRQPTCVPGIGPNAGELDVNSTPNRMSVSVTAIIPHLVMETDRPHDDASEHETFAVGS
jgi:hypothetical protein